MGGLTYRILNNVIIVQLGVSAPDDQTWDQFLAVLIRQCQSQGSVSLIAATLGGGPTVHQRARLARLFAGLPFRLGLIHAASLCQPLLATLAGMQATAFVYAPAALDEAASHFGLNARDLRGCLARLTAELHGPQAA